MSRSFRVAALCGSALVASGVYGAALADSQGKGGATLVVSRIQYVAPSPAPESFPQIFNDPSITGIQGNIFLDYYGTTPGARRRGTLPLTAASVTQGQPVITTSFSSKSEGSLHLSLDGHYLTYMGYTMPQPASKGCRIRRRRAPTRKSPADVLKYDGTVIVTPQNFAYSGDNPRGAISLDGQEYYMAGNADSTLNNTTPVTGSGLTIGARLGMPGSSGSIQLGTYFAADRPDETTKQHIKDNNWRGIGIFADANGIQNLYVSKGSGGNGDDGLFQVLNGSYPSATINDVVNNGTGAGVPSGGTDNTIVQLLGNQAPIRTPMDLRC
jgi:hypothetical protein